MGMPDDIPVPPPGFYNERTARGKTQDREKLRPIKENDCECCPDGKHVPNVIKKADENEREIVVPPAIPEKCEIGIQTDVALPHTMRNVMWTASCLESVLEDDYDLDLEDNATDFNTDIPEHELEDKGVLDFDTVEVSI